MPSVSKSVPLRVAFDVSSVAPLPGVPPQITGVNRAIRHLLEHLLHRDDVDVRAVGCFDEDWNYVTTSLLAELWAGSADAPLQLKARPAIHSRFGLYKPFCSALLHLEAVTRERGGTKGRTDSLLLRVLRKVMALDARREIPAGEFDVFHATFRPPPSMGVHHRVPRVVTIYDVIPGRFPYECGPDVTGQFDRTVRALNPSRDIVVAISDFTRHDFCRFTGFPSERTVSARLAVTSNFQPISDPAIVASLRSRLGLQSRPYFLSVANPQPRKNIPHVVRCFYQFLRICPQWDGVLALAGDVKVGWGIAALDDAINAEPDLAHRVVRLGAVRDEDLPPLYSCAMAFVFPSTYEGFGLPVLEAMACGTPVICSDSTSLPEVAGKAAILVPPRDEQRLIESMLSITSNPALQVELGEAGIKRAAEFTWDRTADHVVNAYRLAHNNQIR